MSESDGVSLIVPLIDDGYGDVAFVAALDFVVSHFKSYRHVDEEGISRGIYWICQKYGGEK